MAIDSNKTTVTDATTTGSEIPSSSSPRETVAQTKADRLDRVGSESTVEVEEEPPDTPESGGQRLEGVQSYEVADASGRTITDIDRIEGGILWEEKTAVDARDWLTGEDRTQQWVAKHIDKKFDDYQEAKSHMPGYEDAPVGFHFTRPGVDPEFRAAVEDAVSDLREQNPGTTIHLRWEEDGTWE
jgi:hypothetical protein